MITSGNAKIDSIVNDLMELHSLRDQPSSAFFAEVLIEAAQYGYELGLEDGAWG